MDFLTQKYKKWKEVENAILSRSSLMDFHENARIFRLT